MNWKFLSGISLAGMMLFATFALAQNPRQTPPQQQDRDQTEHQQQQASKTISGKVTNIGDDRRSFTLQPDAKGNSGDSQNMQFVIDDHTQVRGRVTTGTMVMVEYTPTDGGKNLAISIAPQGGGSGQ